MRSIIVTARLLTGLAIAAISAPFVWETVSGDYFMTVTGVSMRPTYDLGEVLVVQRPTGHDLETVGRSVVVAFTPGDRSSQYVHRVHKVVAGGAVLKGDNNDSVDPGIVTEEHVMGTPRAALTGAQATAFHLSQSWLTRAVVGAAFLASLVVRLPDRRATPSTSSTPPAREALA